MPEVPRVRRPCIVTLGKLHAHASLDTVLPKLYSNTVVNLARHEMRDENSNA